MADNPFTSPRPPTGADAGPAHGNKTFPLHPVEWAVRSHATADVLREMEQQLVRRRRRRRFGGAGLAVVSVAVAFLSWQGAVPSDEAGATPHGPPSWVLNQPDRQTLPDGTTVDLRPGAALKIVYSDSVRRVVLERGEAHFDVMKNPGRPFVVQAGAIDVRAVGTAFSVQITTAATEVIVTEGRVAMQTTVPPPPAGGSEMPALTESPTPLAIVSAGNRAVMATGSDSAAALPRIEPVTAGDVADRLGWRVPQLDLSGCPLCDAVPMFNRHSAVRLVLADPEIGRLRISGRVRADNVESLLHLLADEHGVVATRRGEAEVMLAKRR